MKIDSFTEVLGLTVIAVMVADIVFSSKTASQVTAAGNAWSSILKSAGGK